MDDFLLEDLINIHNGRKYNHLSIGEIPLFGSGGIMSYVDDYLYNGEAILLPRKGTLDNIMFSEGKLWTVDTMYYSTIKNTKVADPFYLYNYLKLLDLRHLDSGSTLPSMTKTAYSKIPVKLPNIIKQIQIAKVLSDLDAKIEVNNQINAKLEAMAKTLYEYWFVQFDFPFDFAQGKPSLNGKPYKSSGGKMVFNDELKREIPKGWEVKTIGDYCKSKGGYAFKSSSWANTGLTVIKIKNIQENYTIDTTDISFSNSEKESIDKKFITKAGNILIAMTGATVGKYAIVPKTENDIYVNQRVGHFDFGKNPTSKLPFLINSLNQSYFRKMIFVLASGAAQPNISNEQINNIKLIHPSLDLIEKYNQKFKPTYEKILNNQFENQKLADLRDWLLPMLMNGQVSVGDAKEYVSGDHGELGMVAEDRGKS